MITPRLEIDLRKIQQNASVLVERLASRGLSVTGVTKVALGNVEIARALLNAGVATIADSRIENIQKMRHAGIAATFLLLRTPMISQIAQVVEHADISFNTEMEVIRQLSQAAESAKKTHRIALMVELGDHREGILPEDLDDTVRQSIQLPNIRLAGIGTNLACLGGAMPNRQKMEQLSDLAQSVEEKFHLTLDFVSGGNSANLEWLFDCSDPGRVSDLRLGESIFLGCETLNRSPIPGLHTDAFTLVTEVIESKIKASLPSGEICQDAFGEKRTFLDRGKIHHAILAIGRQDVLVSGLTTDQFDILGSSSDHLIIDSRQQRLHVGEEVRFRLTYGALLAAMTSPYVKKTYPSCTKTQPR